MLSLCSVARVDAQELVTIDKVVGIIDKKSACEVNRWRGEENQCKCCLVREAISSPGDFDTVVSRCKSFGLCSDKSLETIKKSLKISNDSDLAKRIFDEAVVVKSSECPIFLKDDGTFDADGLINFLACAHQGGQLKNAAFSGKDCLRAEMLGGQKGVQTIQLFRVISTCSKSEGEQKFIVKEWPRGKGFSEPQRLETTRLVPGMSEILWPNMLPGYPTINVPIAYLKYQDKGNKTRYLSIMREAPGKPLKSYVNEYLANRASYGSQLDKIYFELGKAVANFHRRFMDKPSTGKILGKTIIHHDLHVNNVFVSLEGDSVIVSFIDNEMMGNYVTNHQEVTHDLTELWFQLTQWHRIQFEKEDYLRTLSNFIRGYASAFPPDQRRQVLVEIDELFAKAGSPWKRDPAITKEQVAIVIDQLLNEGTGK